MTEFRQTQLINTPMRFNRNLPFLSREFTLFKQLSNLSTHIEIHELIDAYQRVMRVNRLDDGLNTKKYFEILLQVRSPNENYLVNRSNCTISYPAYSSSFQSYLKHQRNYNIIFNGLNNSRSFYVDWRKYGIIVMTTILDSLVGLLVHLADDSLPIFLYIARLSAVIILINILYILLPLAKLSILIPHTILANMFPSEHSVLFHKFFGIKVFALSLIHTIFHFVHIRYSLNKCKNGCTKQSIRIVPNSDHIIVISYGYFMKQYAYITGLLLMFLFCCLFTVAILNHYHAIRFGINQLLHKLFAISCFVGVILHGITHLLGFNFSYILVLPLLLIYLWHHRHEIKKYKVKVARWVIGRSYIKLYLEDTHYKDLLNKFNTATIYVNHSKISLYEWHPFTLSKKNDFDKAIITIKRSGEWTNKLANVLTTNIQFNDYVNLGNILQSKFRFHNLYEVRYFFCAGIGITAFVAAMRDTDTQKKYRSILVWSVSEIEIVKEFSAELNSIKASFQYTDIRIFYSNSKKIVESIDDSTKAKFKYLQSIIYDYSGIDIVSDCISPCCCTLQRADFASILSEGILFYKNKVKTIGVFACGARGYVNVIKKCVHILNHNEHNILLQLWSEFS